MKRILFQPFDFAKWCVIGFAAFLSGNWGNGGNGFRYNFPFNGNWNFRSTSHHNINMPTYESLPIWLLPFIIALVVLVLIFIFVVMWVVSRGRFIFTDCVVKNRAAIVVPWREYRREGNSFFLFSLVVTFLAMVIMAAFVLLIVLPLLMSVCMSSINERICGSNAARSSGPSGATLRTPLTTFKMYSEMLAEDMVPDPARQKEYLHTLCSEANRLGHLVENVLAYARLERGSARDRVERVKLRDLMINGWRARPSELAEYLDQATYQTMFMWTLIGTNIQLTPAPATSPTNTLYFIQGEPALTVDTQSPLIPEAHQPAVLARAAYLSEVHRGRADAAAFHNTEYEVSLRRMMDATKRSNRPRQVREAGYQRWASW
jgi:signal transduction histidine kinase